MSVREQKIALGEMRESGGPRRLLVYCVTTNARMWRPEKAAREMPL